MTMKKKAISILLTIAIVAGIAPAMSLPVPAQASERRFLAPVGPIAENSRAISNRADLEKIGIDADFPLNGNYHLTRDIDLGDRDWVPLGSSKIGRAHV